MRLDLKELIHVPGGVKPFEFQLDLSQREFSGYYPVQEPVQVKGQVRNMAGALVLTATASTTLSLVCDRCAKTFTREMTVPIETLLATELADEQSDSEIYLLEGDAVDLDEVAVTAFVLAMDSKHLCSEDCKGLCPGCGVDLNVEACRCKPRVDPRLAVLAQLLEGEERK